MLRAIKREQFGRGIWHVWDKGELDIEIWLEKVNERGHTEELGTDVRMILKCTSNK
jgi:hypothetical protein